MMLAVLEREDVERPQELVPAEEQRHRGAGPAPAARAGAQAVRSWKSAARPAQECERRRGRSIRPVRDQRLQARPENALQIGRHESQMHAHYDRSRLALALRRARALRHSAYWVDADAGEGRLTIRERASAIGGAHATAQNQCRVLRRRHRSAQPARRPQDESMAEPQRRRHDVRQRRQLGAAARRAGRAAAGRRAPLRAGAGAQRARGAARAAGAAADRPSMRGSAGTPAAICCCR